MRFQFHEAIEHELGSSFEEADQDKLKQKLTKIETIEIASKYTIFSQIASKIEFKNVNRVLTKA